MGGCGRCMGWPLLCVGSTCSCECAAEFHPLTPRLGSNFPDTFCWGGTSSPCPHHQPAVQRPGSYWAGGLSPFSGSLTRAGIAASFILSQRPGPPGLLCQSFCGLGQPYFLSSRQAQRATQRLLACRGHCSSSRTGERHRGDSTPGKES